MREQVALSIPITRLEDQDYVPLNTRGYNYPSPDDSPDRFVPDNTGKNRPAQLPPQRPR